MKLSQKLKILNGGEINLSDAIKHAENMESSMIAIDIIKPKALPGQKVIARNYRKRPADWETGIIVNVETVWRTDGTVSHSYIVKLDRRSKANNAIIISVRQDSIKLSK